MFRKRWLIVLPALLALWIVLDMALPTRAPLTGFDGHEVGRLETDMWRSYYGRQRARLFSRLVSLMRDQFHLPFWRASLAAWHAARAAVVFQRGHNRAEYELALGDLEDYYSIIRRSSETPFNVDSVARLELEWWIVHRERAQHPPADLERSLAALQSAIYQRPEGLFAEHARTRAEAMLLRDAAAEKGGVSEEEWNKIGSLLDTSWTSLQSAVAMAPGLRTRTDVP